MRHLTAAGRGTPLFFNIVQVLETWCLAHELRRPRLPISHPKRINPIYGTWYSSESFVVCAGVELLLQLRCTMGWPMGCPMDLPTVWHAYKMSNGTFHEMAHWIRTFHGMAHWIRTFHVMAHWITHEIYNIPWPSNEPSHVGYIALTTKLFSHVTVSSSRAHYHNQS